MSTATNSTTPARRLLRKRDVAAFLNESLDSTDRRIKRGEIPVIKMPRGGVRIDPDDLDAAIASWKADSQ